jgi:hypothetical protein
VTRLELLSALSDEHANLQRACHALSVAIAELQLLAPVGNSACMPLNKVESGLFGGMPDVHKDGG